MAGSDRWYFLRDQLAATPSRKCAIDADKELSYRQQAANLIQDMGQRLQVSQLCINTAIVYMHRFYMFHSFTKFHRNSISSCALFLAAKVEEQPRKLEHVIKVAHMCLHRDNPALDVKSDAYHEQAMELVINENLMLQTLGFDIAVEHPHTSVVNCCQLVRASKDLAQTSYFMATNSLHLTTMCLQYKPTVVACVCIHLACKWSSWEIPRSSEGKDWFYYVDPTVTLELVEQLTSEFLAILDKCPSRLKRKILSGGTSGPNNCNAIPKSTDDKKSSVKNDVKPLNPSVKFASSQASGDLLGNTVQPTSPSTSPLLIKVHKEPQQSNKMPMSYAAYREKQRNLQQEQTKQSEPNKSNPTKQSVNPISRETIMQTEKDKTVNNNEKLLSKQNQINIDKQKQSDERHRIRDRNQDHLWGNNTRSVNLSKNTATSSAFHQKQSQNNIASEDFFDSLLNRPSNMHFNSIFADGDDSSDFKKEIASELKMEFSDNDSNQSTGGLNLTNIPAFMNDSSDSKTSLSMNNTQSNSIEVSKPTSFMSIFSTPIVSTTNPTTVQPKLEKSNIPNKYSDTLARIKSEPLPPMLSPLKADLLTLEEPAVESQLLHSHNLKFENPAQFNVKSIAELDIKPTISTQQFQNSKVSPKMPKQTTNKASPKNRLPHTHPKNSSQMLPTIDIREKDMSDVQQNSKSLHALNSNPIDAIFNTGINNINNNSGNSLFESIQIKSEFKEKTSKPAETPSVSISKQVSTNATALELAVNSIPELQDQKPDIHSYPSPQNIFNNVINNTETVDGNSAKVSVKKEGKEKHSHEHHERHHHRHHSHKSSKHKDKHKHKHKDKDKDRHKRKDKERSKEKEKHHLSNDIDPSFKISWSSPKDNRETDESNATPRESIKLKISKKKLSVDEPEKSDKCVDLPQNPLKLRIQLKDAKLSSSPTDVNNGSSSSRKRKSSPRNSKKEKLLKQEMEDYLNNTKVNDEILKSKKPNDNAKKSAINLMNDNKNVNKPQPKPLTAAMMYNIDTGLTLPQTSRSSKGFHK